MSNVVRGRKQLKLTSTTFTVLNQNNCLSRLNFALFFPQKKSKFSEINITLKCPEIPTIDFNTKNFKISFWEIRNFLSNFDPVLQNIPYLGRRGEKS
jgi:hypothetical protein